MNHLLAGFNPDLFPTARTNGDNGHQRTRPTFLFAAGGSVRKGLPFLLQAWQASKIKGRLLIVGKIAEHVRQRCAWAWNDPSIEFRPFNENLAPVYREADVFVLPSVEEGSPLVSYMALAASLPCIVSPAAAGWIIRDQVEGLVLDPFDQGAMVEALRRMAGDTDLRTGMSQAAKVRAADYTWDKVAARRCRDLSARI